MGLNHYIASNRPLEAVSKLRIATDFFLKVNVRAYLALLVTFAMVLLPLVLFFQNITVSTLFEESVGFRYFHSLRLAYSLEHPWLPQGQLPGLLHILIQRCLTLFGYPINQFFPRVDLFTNLAIILPLLLAGCIFYWATKPIKSLYILSIFTLVFISCFYSPRFQDGWMLLPDYHIWMISLSLIAIGWSLRILQTDRIYTGFSNKTAVLLGLYAAACVGVKITLATYPIVIGPLYLILDKKFSTIFRMLILSIPVSIITWFLILGFYYHGDFTYIPKHLQSLRTFTDSQIQLLREPFVEFAKGFSPLTLMDLFAFIPLMLIYSLWSRIKYKNRSVVGILFPACVFELYMLYQRNYTHTNVEIQYFFLIVGTIILIDLIQNNNIRADINSLAMKTWAKQDFSRSLILSLLIIIPVTVHYLYIAKRMDNFIRYLRELNAANKGLQQALRSAAGNSLFLIPIKASVDEFNLRTIDNGLLKAANGLHPTWNIDEYVAKLFTNRWYATNSRTMPNISLFNNIIFRTAAYESLDAAMKRLNYHYKTDFKEFDCTKPYFSYTIPTNETTVFCKRISNPK